MATLESEYIGYCVVQLHFTLDGRATVRFRPDLLLSWLDPKGTGLLLVVEIQYDAS
jgi:hypothetical protein